MKKLVKKKSGKEISRTHSIASHIVGWSIRVVEFYNNAFLVEATDNFGRIVSKQGNDPEKLKNEIEAEIREIKTSE